MKKIIILFFVLFTFIFNTYSLDFSLTWNRNPEEENISHYKIYEDDIFIGTVLSSENILEMPIYNITNRTGFHSYYVTAVNLIGESQASNIIYVGQPSKPTGLRFME